ncbi:MAG: hypothetical protein EOP83_26580 [Verrucomicrobiaceae bacterium]|nr:MAG: hypothetical protein EOP83_26580 [Verrucomicrobiaceae bacterium]
MNSLRLPNPKVSVSRIGLQISDKLSVEEWQELATSIGEAASSIAFIVGDWLVYGQSLFGTQGDPDRKVDHPSYQLALKATGLDLSTLQNYAYVSRNVPYSLRTERLSWEHHRLMAKLPDGDMQDWIEACVAEENAGRRMSTRRLRKSLNLGRIATDKDLEPDESDKGIENHIPFVNRLSVWWKRMQGERFLDKATDEQRAAIKRDLEPVVAIYNQL